MTELLLSQQIETDTQTTEGTRQKVKRKRWGKKQAVVIKGNTDTAYKTTSWPITQLMNSVKF